MGRENIFKKLNRTGTAFITLGIVLGIISLFMTLIFLTDGFSAPLVIFFIFLVISVLFIIYGADYKKGENSRYLKKHPGILELADTFTNPVFENDYIIVSDKAIADKKNFLSIVAIDDVLAVYESIMRTNGIVTSHTVTLCAVDGRNLEINVFAKNRDAKDELVLTISHYCPNAMVGYSSETMEYVDAKRKEYKEKNSKA